MYLYHKLPVREIHKKHSETDKVYFKHDEEVTHENHRLIMIIECKRQFIVPLRVTVIFHTMSL